MHTFADVSNIQGFYKENLQFINYYTPLNHYNTQGCFGPI